MSLIIRSETERDIGAIRTLIATAFEDAPHASGREGDILDALRRGGALTLSLVATKDDEVIGHVAFSPALVEGSAAGWFGLGPLAVRRDCRCRGVGRRLTEAGLDALRARQAGGCVVLGDPAYYARFGFKADPALCLAGVPAGYFQSLSIGGDRPHGEVRYHRAFGTS